MRHAAATRATPVMAAATRGARVGDEIRRGRARSPTCPPKPGRRRSAAHVARNASAYTYATAREPPPDRQRSGPDEDSAAGSGIGSHGNTMGASSTASVANRVAAGPVPWTRSMSPCVAAGLVRRTRRDARAASASSGSRITRIVCGGEQQADACRRREGLDGDDARREPTRDGERRNGDQRHQYGHRAACYHTPPCRPDAPRHGAAAWCWGSCSPSP